MLKSILCLSLLTTPLLAQPKSFNSLAKRADILTLEIYIKATEFPNDDNLRAIKCTTTHPVGAEPVTLQVPTPSASLGGAMFGNGLDLATWTDTLDASILTRVPLRVDEGVRNFHVEGLGKGKDLDVSYHCTFPDILWPDTVV